MAGLGRASATVAAGTMASRITGLIRNIVLAAALPVVAGGAADAFAVANALPNTVFNLISSGLLAGVTAAAGPAASRKDEGQGHGRQRPHDDLRH